MKDVACIEVAEASAVSMVRRAATSAAHDAGFDETGAGAAGIVATELASNLQRHSGVGGEVLVRGVSCDGVSGVELIALDRGPGLHDLDAALLDGYSTAGGLGGGLGAVRRLSSLFDVYAPPGRGTAVLCRLWARAPDPPPPARRLSVGAVSVPVRGELVSGDSWAVHQDRDRVVVLVADGLGHGEFAAEASAAAVEAFRAHVQQPAGALVPTLDAALRHTRGAAVAVAEAALVDDVVDYAGLGNVCARVTGFDGSCQLVADDGIAGACTRHTHVRRYSFPPGSLLVMHTDGVSASWKPDDYPGLWAHHPVLIAAVIFRDHGRGRDDATVVVAARREAQP